MPIIAALIILSSAVASCRGGNSEDGTPRAVLVEGTGDYGRPISTSSPDAQKFFDQGLRLTYGYFFPDALASFQEALRLDSHPMIYWGMALAIGPNPNSRYLGFPDDPAGEGRKAIQEAIRLTPNASEMDRAFIEALHVRYDVETYPDRETRDQAYLQQARSLAERYPDSSDAATLYADAFMTTSPWSYWDSGGRPLSGTLDVAEALERAMERDPRHPGTNHLYIHLFEASLEPERALPQADRLAGLMPVAGHIVHMPSHIYVRIGDYARSIETNERSVAADKTFLAAWGDTPFPQTTTYPLSSVFHSAHSRDFIRYSATVQGNYRKAIDAARASERVVLDRVGLDAGRTQRTVATVWLVHKIFGKWDALLAEPGPPAQGYPYLQGMWHYARGSAYVARGDLDGAGEELHALRAAAADPKMPGLLVLANPASTLLQLAAFGLEGEIAQARGTLDAAIASFEAAVEIEDALGYMEPPDWAQSMRHYVGAALLAAGRPVDAEQIYLRDLRWSQENGWALFGLWQSLRDQGKAAEAEQVNARFLKAWAGADVELGASRF
jgi:tetratricopeptide (TPR) repeat protein